MAKSNEYWILLGDAYCSIIDACLREKWLNSSLRSTYNFPFWILTDDEEGIEFSYPGIEKKNKKQLEIPYIFNFKLKYENKKFRHTPNIKGPRDAREFAKLAQELSGNIRLAIEKGEIQCATVYRNKFRKIEDQQDIFWAQIERDVFYSGRIHLPGKKNARLLALDRACFDIWLTRYRQRKANVEGYPDRYKPTLDGVIEALVRKVCDQLPAEGASLNNARWRELLNHYFHRFNIMLSESAMNHKISPRIISKIDPYREGGNKRNTRNASKVKVEQFVATIKEMIDDEDHRIIPGDWPSSSEDQPPNVEDDGNQTARAGLIDE